MVVEGTFETLWLIPSRNISYILDMMKENPGGSVGIAIVVVGHLKYFKLSFKTLVNRSKISLIVDTVPENRRKIISWKFSLVNDNN